MIIRPHLFRSAPPISRRSVTHRLLKPKTPRTQVILNSAAKSNGNSFAFSFLFALVDWCHKEGRADLWTKQDVGVAIKRGGFSLSKIPHELTDKRIRPQNIIFVELDPFIVIPAPSFESFHFGSGGDGSGGARVQIFDKFYDLEICADHNFLLFKFFPQKVKPEIYLGFLLLDALIIKTQQFDDNRLLELNRAFDDGVEMYVENLPSGLALDKINPGDIVFTQTEPDMPLGVWPRFGKVRLWNSQEERPHPAMVSILDHKYSLTISKIQKESRASVREAAQANLTSIYSAIPGEYFILVHPHRGGLPKGNC